MRHHRAWQSEGGIVLLLLGVSLIPSGAWGQFPDAYKFGADTDFTIAAWINTLGFQQTTDISLISNKNWGSGGNPGYLFTVDNTPTGNEWKVNANASGGTRIDTDWVGIDLNQWYFVAATFTRGGEVIAYHQGNQVGGPRTTPVGSMDTYASPSFLDFNIGQDGTGNYGGGQGYKGLIDDVAIWGRALDPLEIAYIYNQGIASNSLADLLGTSAGGGLGNIGDDIRGYYAFDGDLGIAAGTGPAGVAKQSPGGPGSVGFASGLFGQALSLDGTNYVSIGEAELPADANFTGLAAANNHASNSGNWDLALANWTTDTNLVIASGTTASFSGAQTGPAVFDASFTAASIPETLGNLRVGTSGATTFVEFKDDAAFIGGGAADSIIGLADSTVHLAMSGTSRLEHRGAGEENTEISFGRQGATITITMTDDAVISSGPLVADSRFVTGYRRPVAEDDQPRHGDDIKLGEGDGGALQTVKLTMNGNSRIESPDVFYPGDGNNNRVDVVQNDDSQVIINWDTRFLEASAGVGTGVNWTLNDNSRFIVARDHGIGESASQGYVNITVNGSAEFIAGDRIVLGAGGGNVNLTLNSGLVKVGGDSPTDVKLADNTGDPGDVTDQARPVDWILHMGGGANAIFNVNGGEVEIGRHAYVGRGGGKATLNLNGGTFNILGVGPGTSDSPAISVGNSPGGGVPGNDQWRDAGGDFIIGDSSSSADSLSSVGQVNYSGGAVSVARDLVVGGNSFDATGGNRQGTLKLNAVASDASTANNSFTVAGDLAFGGNLFDSSGAASRLTVAVHSGDLAATLNVTGTNSDSFANNDPGSVYIYNTGGSISEFSASVAPGATPGPVNKTYTVVKYAGDRALVDDFDGNSVGEGTQGAGTFVEDHSGGVDYTLVYDNAAKEIRMATSFIYAPGDANKSSTSNPTVDQNDLNAIKTAGKYGQQPLSRATWGEGDFNDDGQVDGRDLLLASPLLGVGNYLENSTGSTNATGTLLYDPATGNIKLQSDVSSFDSFVLTSATGALNGSPAETVDEAGDFHIDNNFQIAENFFSTSVTAGNVFDLGNVAAANLTASFLVQDLTAFGGLTGNSNFEFAIQLVGAILAGDYNGDGVVNAADYVVWRDHVGATSALLNDPIGGTVGNDQYDTWRANFGASPAGSGAGAVAANVPEPSSVLLAILGCLAVGLIRRQR